MPDKAKIPVVIMSLLILISLSLAASGYYLLQKEKTKNVMLQEELHTLSAKLKDTEAKLEEHKNTISMMELKIKDAQDNIDTLTSNLEQETRDKQKAENQLLQLTQDLQQQKKLRTDLEAKLQQMQKDTEVITARLKDIMSQKAELESKIKALETEAQQAKQTQGQGVELGTIVVAPEDAGKITQAKKSESVSKKPTKEQAAKKPKEQAAKKPKEQAAPASLEGKVLVVNKEYNFIVINIGSKDGVKPGDVFALYNNNKYIGDIKVAKIHESMSAADFLTPSIKDVASEGDRVVQKAK